MATSRLRIAGGTLRGLPISEPRGLRLRPTSGLVREAIFNIIGELVEGQPVADLYAGTGALGLEALSYGASAVSFIEAEAAGCQAILQSLARAAKGPSAKVIRGRLPAALKLLEGSFSVVFMDPPYADEAEETLTALQRFLMPAGVVVYEHGSRYNPPGRPAGLHLQDRRVYGDSAVAIYELAAEDITEGVAEDVTESPGAEGAQGDS